VRSHADSVDIEVLIADVGDSQLILRSAFKVRVLVQCDTLIKWTRLIEIKQPKDDRVLRREVGHCEDLILVNLLLHVDPSINYESISVDILHYVVPIVVEVQEDVADRLWCKIISDVFRDRNLVCQIHRVLEDKDAVVRYKHNRGGQIEGKADHSEWSFIEDVQVLVLEGNVSPEAYFSEKRGR
jgi:hypothetical protein